jgi:hypothetical protein
MAHRPTNDRLKLIYDWVKIEKITLKEFKLLVRFALLDELKDAPIHAEFNVILHRIDQMHNGVTQ